MRYAGNFQAEERYGLVEVAHPELPIPLGGVVDEILFGPGDRVLVVDYVEAQGEMRSLADPEIVLAELPGSLDRVEFNPDGSVVRLRYVDGTSELWDLDGAPGRLLDLGSEVAETIFSAAGDRLVVRYADGRVYLLDVGWLRALNRDVVSVEELVDLACEGPLALGLIGSERLASFLEDIIPQACRV